jgi:hypothetical protein
MTDRSRRIKIKIATEVTARKIHAYKKPAEAAGTNNGDLLPGNRVFLAEKFLVRGYIQHPWRNFICVNGALHDNHIVPQFIDIVFKIYG